MLCDSDQQRCKPILWAAAKENTEFLVAEQRALLTAPGCSDGGGGDGGGGDGGGGAET